MTRVFLVTTLVAIPAVLAARPANADDVPPCAAEAEAVRRMPQRDRSLEYPKDEAAKAHLEVGKRAFGVGEYEKAVESYTAAGLLDDAPLILYNLGQTYRAAKDYEKAIRQYRLFLERGKPGAEVRAVVECHIATMTAEMEHAASTAPPTGPAPDDDPHADPTSGPEPIALPPAEPAHGASRWSTSRKVAIGVGTTGVLVLAAGVVFGVQSQGYKDDAARLCPSNPCGAADEANEFSAKASDRATLANISYGVGAAMVAGAALLWVVGAPEPEDRGRRASIVPQVSGDFAGLAYGMRF